VKIKSTKPAFIAMRELEAGLIHYEILPIEQNRGALRDS
jgi:DNA-directed RNA polymerase subunit K/omega